jgi:hypothetical protein
MPVGKACPGSDITGSDITGSDITGRDITGRDITGSDIIATLRSRIADYRRQCAVDAGWVPRYLPTGLLPLDECLPHGGLPCGTITEILCNEDGVGALVLAMRMVGADLDCVLLIDSRGDFYPPGAACWGVSPERLVVVRAADRREAFWAADQSLRCPGLPVVVAIIDDLSEQQSRRLQLAARSSGAIGLLIRPGQSRHRSFAAVRVKIESLRHSLPSALRQAQGQPVDGSFDGPFDGSFLSPGAIWGLCRLSILSVREGVPSSPILVDLCDEKGLVSVPAVPVERSMAKTG